MKIKIVVLLLSTSEFFFDVAVWFSRLAQRVLPVESLSVDEISAMLSIVPAGYYCYRLRDRKDFLTFKDNDNEIPSFYFPWLVGFISAMIAIGINGKFMNEPHGLVGVLVVLALVIFYGVAHMAWRIWYRLMED